MQGSRRLFIKGLAVMALLGSSLGQVFIPIRVNARERTKAFSKDTETEALAALYPGEEIIPSDKIVIDSDDVIENGAVVPLSVKTELPGVSSITILVEKNPNPLIARFNLHPDCKGFIATRIKVAEHSDIIAVVRSKGQLYSTRKFVEVIAGGCG